MTYEELMEFIEEFQKAKEAFLRGEIEDEMSPECRKNWIEKCNACGQINSNEPSKKMPLECEQKKHSASFRC